MREEGTVAVWKDDKGFGFIKPRNPGADVFFNIADFRSASSTRPAIGLVVSFELIHVGGKGPRAMAVRPAHEARAHAPRTGRRTPASAPPDRARAPASGALVALPLMLAYYALLLAAVWRGLWPVWVIGASIVVNLLTFFLYWQDKYKATQRAWRVPEQVLHGWSLAGGWPGAWFAQQVLRHKSVKAPFRAGYWATVLAHCGAIGALAWRQGLLAG